MKQRFFEAYDKIGKEDIRWFLIPYWFERFGIRKDCREFIAERAHRTEMYEDAIEAFGSLERVVISTNAPVEFVEAEVEAMKRRISDTEIMLYSAVSDFGILKKDPALSVVPKLLKTQSFCWCPLMPIYEGDGQTGTPTKGNKKEGNKDFPRFLLKHIRFIEHKTGIYNDRDLLRYS